MLTIRASTIEKFRSVIQSEWSNEEELLSYVVQRQSSEASEYMRAGTAWHELLTMDDPAFTRVSMCEEKTGRGNVYPNEIVAEIAASQLRTDVPEVEAFPCGTCGQWHLGKPTGIEDELGITTVDGFTFRKGDWKKARQHVGPGGLHEFPWGRTFDTKYGPCRITGIVDWYLHPVIQDHKTCFKPPSVEEFERSMQWRIYMLMHDAECFRYNLFHFRKDKDQNCELREIIAFNVWRYNNLETDVRDWLSRFLDWAHRNDLFWYLDRELQLAASAPPA